MRVEKKRKLNVWGLAPDRMFKTREKKRVCLKDHGTDRTDKRWVYRKSSGNRDHFLKIGPWKTERWSGN